MISPNTSMPESKSTKPAWLSGCLAVVAILFGLLAVGDLIYGSVVTYIFASAKMLSTTKIAVILIIACDCFIYFVLAFRIKRQHWVITLALLAIVWLILPISLRVFINLGTMRLRMEGFSMGSSLPNGSYILADRNAYQQRLPQRGDVVVLQLPAEANDVIFVKRVIGLPGEAVSIKQGQVFINGIALDEPYVAAQATYSGEWEIPEGYYFVLGDNRPDSIDSHQRGFFSHENILAKAVWIYWPFTNFGKIIGSGK